MLKSTIKMVTTRGSRATTPDQTPTKRFKCNFCQRRFSRREHLQRHNTIHYGQKPFRCTLCSYACRRRDLLNRHAKLSHSKDRSGETNGGSRTTLSNEEDARPDNQSGRGDRPQTDPTLDTNIDQSAIWTPARQSNIDPITSYISTTGQLSSVPADVSALLNPPSVPDSFEWNYLDSVALPFLVDQPALFPELSLNDPFSHSPPLVNDIVQNPDIDNIDTFVSDQPNPNPLAISSDVARHHLYLAPFLRVTQDDWVWLSSEVSRFNYVLPTGYDLPSRHAISRYLHGFINGFHPHFPILHPQTLSLREMAPELTLALAAVGSQYCLESHQGLMLFPISRAIAIEKIRLRDLAVVHSSVSHPQVPYPQTPSSPAFVGMSGPGDKGTEQQPASENEYALVETMQALFYLMAMSTWGGENKSLVRQAISTQSILAMLARQDGLTEVHATTRHQTWKEWARAESARRLKLIIFCFFNLHTLVFNLPSPLMIADIQLRLPCSESEWKASDSDSWLAVHQRSQPSPLFQDSIAELLRSKSRTPVCSSLGSHVLIHALLQHVFSIRHSDQLESIEENAINRSSDKLRQALKKWQKGWEMNPESSPSPLDKHGPIAFNSTALFHLAYIRLVVNIGPARSLLEQNHVQIATRLKDQPKLQRSPMLVLAARHATAALSSPVQMGVYFVSRVPNWSVMHAVCALEYAYILNQFLLATTAPDLEDPLEPDERALLNAVKETLREVESSTPNGNPRVIDTMPQLLGSKAVRAWALILQGMKTWSTVDLITRTLFTYAELLDVRHAL